GLYRDEVAQHHVLGCEEDHRECYPQPREEVGCRHRDTRTPAGRCAHDDYDEQYQPRDFLPRGNYLDDLYRKVEITEEDGDSENVERERPENPGKRSRGKRALEPRALEPRARLRHDAQPEARRCVLSGALSLMRACGPPSARAGSSPRTRLRRRQS